MKKLSDCNALQGSKKYIINCFSYFYEYENNYLFILSVLNNFI